MSKGVRAKRAAETREKLLAAATRLIVARGYAATSVDAICGAAGVTKGSFFHHFKGKEELAGEALARWRGRMFQRFVDFSQSEAMSPAERLYAFVDNAAAKLEADPIFGCLLGGLSLEVANSHPVLSAQCAASLTGWAESLKTGLDQLILADPRLADLDTLGLAQHFIATLQGALILARVHDDRAIIGRTLGHYRDYLKTLLEPPNPNPSEAGLA